METTTNKPDWIKAKMTTSFNRESLERLQAFIQGNIPENVANVTQLINHLIQHHGSSAAPSAENTQQIKELETELENVKNEAVENKNTAEKLAEELSETKAETEQLRNRSEIYRAKLADTLKELESLKNAAAQQPEKNVNQTETNAQPVRVGMFY